MEQPPGAGTHGEHRDDRAQPEPRDKEQALAVVRAQQVAEGHLAFVGLHFLGGPTLWSTPVQLAKWGNGGESSQPFAPVLA